MGCCRSITIDVACDAREKYWAGDYEDKTNTLVQMMREGYNKETEQFQFYIQIDMESSVKVCQKAFRTFFGISNDRMVTLKKLAQAGKPSHLLNFQDVSFCLNMYLFVYNMCITHK